MSLEPLASTAVAGSQHDVRLRSADQGASSETVRTTDDMEEQRRALIPRSVSEPAPHWAGGETSAPLRQAASTSSLATAAAACVGEAALGVGGPAVQAGQVLYTSTTAGAVPGVNQVIQQPMPAAAAPGVTAPHLASVAPQGGGAAGTVAGVYVAAPLVATSQPMNIQMAAPSQPINTPVGAASSVAPGRPAAAQPVAATQVANMAMGTSSVASSAPGAPQLFNAAQPSSMPSGSSSGAPPNAPAGAQPVVAPLPMNMQNAVASMAASGVPAVTQHPVPVQVGATNSASSVQSAAGQQASVLAGAAAGLNSSIATAVATGVAASAATSSAVQHSGLMHGSGSAATCVAALGRDSSPVGAPLQAGALGAAGGTAAPGVPASAAASAPQLQQLLAPAVAAPAFAPGALLSPSVTAFLAASAPGASTASSVAPAECMTPAFGGAGPSQPPPGVAAASHLQGNQSAKPPAGKAPGAPRKIGRFTMNQAPTSPLRKSILAQAAGEEQGQETPPEYLLAGGERATPTATSAVPLEHMQPPRKLGRFQVSVSRECLQAPVGGGGDMDDAETSRDDCSTTPDSASLCAERAEGSAGSAVNPRDAVRSILEVGKEMTRLFDKMQKQLTDLLPGQSISAAALSGLAQCQAPPQLQSTPRGQGGFSVAVPSAPLMRRRPSVTDANTSAMIPQMPPPVPSAPSNASVPSNASRIGAPDVAKVAAPPGAGSDEAIDMWKSLGKPIESATKRNHFLEEENKRLRQQLAAKRQFQAFLAAQQELCLKLNGRPTGAQGSPPALSSPSDMVFTGVPAASATAPALSSTHFMDAGTTSWPVSPASLGQPMAPLAHTVHVLPASPAAGACPGAVASMGAPAVTVPLGTSGTLLPPALDGSTVPMPVLVNGVAGSVVPRTPSGSSFQTAMSVAESLELAAMGNNGVARSSSFGVVRIASLPDLSPGSDLRQLAANAARSGAVASWGEDNGCSPDVRGFGTPEEYSGWRKVAFYKKRAEENS